jgi:hypothetical protein
MTRREKLEARAERRRAWADKAAARSADRLGAARAVADQIPFGQPILVGHHSERRARRDASRIHGNMAKGLEEHRLAESHATKAASIDRALDRSIFSDDTDAVARLRTRIAQTETEAARSNAINKAWCKVQGAPAERAAALVLAGVVSARLGAEMERTMSLCPWLGKPLDATGLRASIRRDKARLAELEKAAGLHSPT